MYKLFSFLTQAEGSVEFDQLQFSGLGIEVFLDHECHLESNGVLKLAQVKACELTDLFKSVNQSVSVNEQLSGRFGNIQVIFKERLDSLERLSVERFKTALLEHLLQEHLT